ncbi:MAG TPA: 3-oxoacyl-ACP synthase [Candidatus Latescibacteria bacterium]|nr:3-oxoacyl-ACP synthase [Gemmatimonadota bacterium]HCR18763.1 3-oxoacyl-ACP synthase [Candidatus Latescibacterota bacterium]|tara:strand:+ start:1074 stop:2066 length:993 start_codon:yes stop_codon:yes gene_type:complete
MKKFTAAITGVSHYVPEKRLTNADLEKIVDTSDEWIRTRTGIQERRILDDGLGASFMATRALEQLLEQKSLGPEEIDLIVVATVTPDMIYPATACLVQDQIGAVNAWGFDLSAACCGFLYALIVGAQFVESGAHKNVVVIGSDKMSSVVDYTDKSTCVLFGDGAGAVLLEPCDEKEGILDFILKVDGSGGDFLCQPAGGSLRPASHETVDAKLHYVKQDGARVLKFASSSMAAVSADLLERNGLTGEDVTLLVPHQANKRIIDATVRRMKLPSDRVIINIDKYANTTCGTIPIALNEAVEQERIKKGDYVVLASAGAGYTWGSALLKWVY